MNDTQESIKPSLSEPDETCTFQKHRIEIARSNLMSINGLATSIKHLSLDAGEDSIHSAMHEIARMINRLVDESSDNLDSVEEVKS